ncbi:MAG: streptomycin 6-kinase [Solirubrobacteraceae bacterium]
MGDAAFDVLDWVFWAVDDPGAWEPRCRALALTLGLDHVRLWAWCAALAAMLAAAEAARGTRAEQVAALLAPRPRPEPSVMTVMAQTTSGDRGPAAA